MNVLAVTLITIAIALAILLMLVLFTLWKYIQRKKKNQYSTDSSSKFLIKGKKRSRFSKPSFDDFQVPVSTRTVNAQIPFLIENHGSNSSLDYSYHSLPRKYHQKSSSLTDDLINRERKSRSDTLPLPEKEELLMHSLPEGVFNEPTTITQFEKKQIRISSSVLEHLSKQGRKVSAIDLRGPSLSDDMFMVTLSNESGLNNNPLVLITEGDTESTHSNRSQQEQLSKSTGDIYKSTTIGQRKRRLGERRAVKSDAGLGYVQPLRKTYKKSGTITFTTQYFENEHTFEVHLLRALDLAPKRSKAEVNPYVRLYLLPGKKQKHCTAVMKHRKEPFFNERFLFTDLNNEDFNKYKLKMKVFNSKLTKDELLGEVDIALNSVDLKSKETFNIDFFLERSESSLASVAISICHQATFQKLEVIVKEAKHLPRVGVPLGVPSPYASVSLFKEKSLERKDTTTKRSTKDPVFNESIEFDIHTDYKTPLSTFSLVITLNHHSLVGKDEILGHVIFSLSSPQLTAAEHWKEVQNGPHQHHLKWHSLIDPDEL